MRKARAAILGSEGRVCTAVGLWDLWVFAQGPHFLGVFFHMGTDADGSSAVMLVMRAG